MTSQNFIHNITKSTLRNLLEPNQKENNSIQDPNSNNPSLSYKGVVAIFILIFYTVAEPIFHKINFHYLHESGICMIVGMIIALISKYLANMKDSLNNFVAFDDEMFFNIVLPPIIFSAGYNLKKKAFFQYFFYIVAFGIFGTLISFGSVSSLIIFSNKLGTFSPFNLDIKIILLFASVIASTDTVAAMTFIKEDKMPKLFSVLFGEGVLNDAVCIVLYNILSKFDFENKKIGLTTILSIISTFLFLFFISCFLGISGGLLCSFLLKILKPFHLNRVQETSLIIFFAFLTYLISEMWHLSPIISLLFCGIFMSHYAFYNLSFQAREESSIVSKILSNIAEGFVFTYLGLSSISINYDSFSFKFLVLIFFFVLLGRFLSVCGISFILNIFRLKIFTFDKSEQGITFFAGCIRGAIAFGLAISIPAESTEQNKNKKMLISSTLILVFLTTVLFGALMSPIVKFFSRNKTNNRDNRENENENNFEELKNYSLQGFDGETLTIGDFEKYLNKPRNFNNNKIQGLWKKIDEKFLKPIFIDDATARDEHTEIAKEVMHVFELHEKNKLKKKMISQFKANNGISFEENYGKNKKENKNNDKGDVELKNTEMSENSTGDNDDSFLRNDL